MAVNITSIKTSSNGAWQGDNPLNFAFPLLIVQTTLILALTRFLALLFKPLRQPKVIAEIVGGILLGPSALGRNQDYLHRIFPSWSMPILESVASLGLLFFLFLVGLELDLTSVRRTGRRAFGIAFSGISLPFISGIGVAFVIRKTVDGADQVGYGQFLVFMGVALSITAFPVLARILAELKLLTTPVGETAMAAAAFNDVAAWILLALAVALAGDGPGEHKSPLISIWVLLSGVAFVAFMMIVIRPAMKWVARRCSPERDVVDEAYICLTLAGVMVSGFITDLIGIHSIFGAFIFGLTIPKEGVFAERLIERIEDFVTGLLLPLYFASSGLKTNVAAISGGRAWGLLVMVISTACAGKIIGTFAVALMFGMAVRESLALGFLMNTKGLVELIVLNIGKEKKVLNDEVFAILVLMALFTTFITTPTVMAIYKPARRSSALTRRKLRDLTNTDESKDELRILACLHGLGNVPSIITLIESTRSTKKSKLKLFIMHLVELTERSSSIIMVHRARRNGLPFINRFRRGEWHDRVAGAFQAYSQLGRVSVRPTTAVSSLSTMHEDICYVAETKRVTMIVLPFHKQQWRGEGDQETIENVGHGWRLVNQRVLKNAPCSVAVLVDRGFGTPRHTGSTTSTQRVCILFFGGADDREALELGGRLAEHPAVKVVVVGFVEDEECERNGVILKPSASKSSEKHYSFSTVKLNPEKEKELDEATMAEFRSKWDGMVEYTEKTTSNIVEDILGLGQCGDYDLIVVGKGRYPSPMVAKLADRQAEHPELGPIGDLLASSGRRILSSALVIQQHDPALMEETPVTKVVENDCDKLKGDGNADVGEISRAV
ncbi:cation/H+ exchanger 20 [Hibiscus trionum]|uniref:Cation/H+ exchanger 20 n=1 Tax=Hibiscus trionum TaxID=183268 RepID=A0A9W7LM91_HIBTR|nr:cation/H+ exchanger 20 [Hibiscus trionum]